MGILLIVLPAIEIPALLKYQQELKPGLGYLPVFFEYFGTGMLFATLVLSLRPIAVRLTFADAELLTSRLHDSTFLCRGQYFRVVHVQDVDVERLIRDDPPEPIIFVLERFDLRDIAYFKATELRFQCVKRCWACAMLAAEMFKSFHRTGLPSEQGSHRSMATPF